MKDILSSEWLNAALESSADWSHGSVRVAEATRIGEAHGMSGRIYRVALQTSAGRSVSVVVKEETAEAVERELLFRREVGSRVGETVPRCYAGTTDAGSGRGVLVFEDIAPATQGDVLSGCTQNGAAAVVSALARIHAATWRREDDFGREIPRWAARPMDEDSWLDRLTRAHERFPDVLGAELVARLRRLPETVDVSLDRLRSGPAAWIHADAHLDNVLWQPDGTAVVLDWCSASIGPPAADLARFLSEGVERRRRATLISTYAEELERNGIRTAKPIVEQVSRALPNLLQSAIGWAGRRDLPESGRPLEICAAWLRSVCGWALYRRAPRRSTV